MRSQIQFSAAKNYFLGFATSGAVLLSGLYYFNSKTPPAEAPKVEETMKFMTAETVPLQDFDPNELTEEQWMTLGFSERQVATILKYKQVVGGAFKSKEQFKKCYAVSVEKYAQLEPYILLPEQSSGSYQRFANQSSTYHREYTPKSSTKKSLNIPGKFNPDHFTAQDFIKMGFSDKQAASILKYKNYLGGSFISKEKFGECYMISEENFRQLKPYLLLPDTAPSSVAPQNNFRSKSGKEQISYRKFDPNTTDLEGWKQLGFSEKQAQVIINYRDRNLKGSFKTLEDIERCFVISPEKFAELKPYIVLNPETFTTAAPKKSGSDNNSSFAIDEPKTDFSKTDLNEITYKQLLEFGFDEKSAGMMLGFRKKLGGFVTKQQIVDTYDIDKNLAQKLISTARLDDSKVARYTLVDAPEEWLKNHPYFKYSADKIIFYRISNPDDRKIWKLLKVKPEYENRMKLYLKGN